MTKKALINDINFRQKCVEYGIYWENIEIYENVILINTPIEGLYVIFDKNYNTIGVEKNEYQDEKQFINDFYKRYSKFTDVLPFGESFDYPFQNYTLKNFIDLVNRVDILEINHGHSISTKINGKWYNRNSQENEEYFQLLSYVKFISKEIKMYFLLSYHMQAMGFEVPNIYEYLRTLMSRLNDCVGFHLDHNRRPCPSYILSGLGQNYRELKMDGILYDVADLLMSQKGYKVKSGSPDEIEMIDSPKERKDLSIVAQDLLQILELSDEELKIKEQRDREKLVEKQLNNLRTYIEEDIEDDVVEEKVPILKKRKSNNN